jgi:hypothetical protein
MMCLLGNEEAEAEMRQIWTDALSQCEDCDQERITYADFLMLMKGQTREQMEPRRASLLRPPPDASLALDAVPEGSVSPPGKHRAFARFDGISALDNMLTLPSLGIPTIGEGIPANMPFPPVIPLPQRVRARSRSLGETPIPYWEDDDGEEEGEGLSGKLHTRSSGYAPPSQAIDELELVVKDHSKTALFVHRSLFRKNREMRNAVLEASRQFDLKRQALKCQETPSGRRTSQSPGANLVMRRGSVASNTDIPNSMHDSWQQIPGLVDSQQQELTSKSEHDRVQAVEDASRRSGRPRRKRTKTASDIAGMLR